MIMVMMTMHDHDAQVLSQVIGGGEETTTPFSNIFPTTTLPTLGHFSYKYFHTYIAHLGEISKLSRFNDGWPINTSSSLAGENGTGGGGEPGL